MDAEVWRKIIGSTIYANLAKELCTKVIDDVESIAPVMPCRLIPLAKAPCVRPIGTGKVLRRIIGKVVMSILREDISETSDNLQLCAGHKVCCEIAVHTTVEMFNDDDTHGILQIHLNNAFD